MALPKIYGEFICTDCGRLKSRLDMCFEPHGELVTDDVCSCGGYFDEAARCPDCGEVFAESALVNYEGICICSKCRDIRISEDELEEAS